MYNLNNYFLHIYHLIVAHYWNSFSISVNRYSLKWLPWRWPLFTWHLFTWKNLALYVDFITWLIRHFQIESRNASLLRDDIVQKAHFTSKKTETLWLSNLSILYSEGSQLDFFTQCCQIYCLFSVWPVCWFQFLFILSKFEWQNISFQTWWKWLFPLIHLHILWVPSTDLVKFLVWST